MNMPTRYSRKPLEVVALPWTGENVEAMTAFLGGLFDVNEDAESDVERAGVLTSRHSSWESLYPGDVVTLGPGGTVSRFDEQTFADDYVEVA